MQHKTATRAGRYVLCGRGRIGLSLACGFAERTSSQPVLLDIFSTNARGCFVSPNRLGRCVACYSCETVARMLGSGCHARSPAYDNFGREHDRYDRTAIARHNNTKCYALMHFPMRRGLSLHRATHLSPPILFRRSFVRSPANMAAAGGSDARLPAQNSTLDDQQQAFRQYLMNNFAETWGKRYQ
jgi:hypothetical protein